MALNAVMNFRTTEDMKEKIKTIAKRENKSTSSWLLDVISKAVRETDNQKNLLDTYFENN